MGPPTGSLLLRPEGVFATGSSPSRATRSRTALWRSAMTGESPPLAGGGARARRTLRRMRDHAGLRQLPHAHGVRGLRRVRRRPPLLRVDRPARRAEAAARPRRHGRDRHRRRPPSACVSGITTVGDCSFVGAAVDAAARTGLRATVYLEVFGEDAPRRWIGSTKCAIGSSLGSPTTCELASRPHAPYTCTLALYEACARWAFRPRPTSRRASRSGAISPTGRATGPRSRRCSCRRRAPRGSGSSPRPACSART